MTLLMSVIAAGGRLEGIIQTQNAKIEQAQNKELEMSFAEEELENYVADLVAANVIETDKTSRQVWPNGCAWVL